MGRAAEVLSGITRGPLDIAMRDCGLNAFAIIGISYQTDVATIRAPDAEAAP